MKMMKSFLKLLPSKERMANHKKKRPKLRTTRLTAALSITKQKWKILILSRRRITRSILHNQIRMKITLSHTIQMPRCNLTSIGIIKSSL